MPALALSHSLAAAGQGGGGAPAAADLLHIIFIGQSNATGGDSTPIITDEVVSDAFMFAGGLAPAQVGLGSLIQLAEQTSTTLGETGAVSLARWLRANGGNHKYLFSNVAVGGAPYAGLAKGTQPYADSIAQVAAGQAFADANDMNYRVLCFVVIHGENDDASQNTSYPANLATWQSDYEADVKVITSQVGIIPHIHAQMGVVGALTYNAADFAGASSLNLQIANRSNPTKIILAAPEGTYDFIASPHFSAASHAWLGEQFAKVIKAVCLDGGSFNPIYPTSANASGSTIVVNFTVPIPPLRLNYRWAAYDDSAGFRFDSSDGPVLPTAVAVTGASQLTLTFAGALTGTSKRLAYGVGTGLVKVQRAYNVSDSDVTESEGGFDLSNFLPSFAIAVT